MIARGCLVLLFLAFVAAMSALIATEPNEWARFFGCVFLCVALIFALRSIPDR